MFCDDYETFYIVFVLPHTNKFGGRLNCIIQTIQIFDFKMWT